MWQLGFEDNSHVHIGTIKLVTPTPKNRVWFKYYTWETEDYSGKSFWANLALCLFFSTKDNFKELIAHTYHQLKTTECKTKFDKK